VVSSPDGGGFLPLRDIVKIPSRMKTTRAKSSQRFLIFRLLFCCSAGERWRAAAWYLPWRGRAGPSVPEVIPSQSFGKLSTLAPLPWICYLSHSLAGEEYYGSP
jgi:hypothetical protein